MVRVRKPQPTLDSIFFSTPEQKVVRFMLSEPTTAFTPRVISSRLKGVRGLGGAEGIVEIMTELQSAGLVDFVDNNRAVRLRDDSPIVEHLKAFVAICDLEGLRDCLLPISSKGILFGARAEGKAASDSEYDLCVISDTPEEVAKVTSRHPLGKLVRLIAKTPDGFGDLEREDPQLAQKIGAGIVIWGASW